jgi:hypothetical protein
MVWLGLGQFLGLMMGSLLASRDVSPLMLSTMMGKAQVRTPLLTDALLEKLGLYHHESFWRWFTIWRRILKFGEYYFFMVAKLPLLLPLSKDLESLVSVMFLSSCYGLPAIWGFVLVGQMLRSYGTCTQIWSLLVLWLFLSIVACSVPGLNQAI